MCYCSLSICLQNKIINYFRQTNIVVIFILERINQSIYRLIIWNHPINLFDFNKTIWIWSTPIIANGNDIGFRHDRIEFLFVEWTWSSTSSRFIKLCLTSVGPYRHQHIKQWKRFCPSRFSVKSIISNKNYLRYGNHHQNHHLLSSSDWLELMLLSHAVYTISYQMFDEFGSTNAKTGKEKNFTRLIGWVYLNNLIILFFQMKPLPAS